MTRRSQMEGRSRRSPRRRTPRNDASAVSRVRLCCRPTAASTTFPTATTQNRIPSLAAYALADQSDGTQVSQADPVAGIQPGSWTQPRRALVRSTGGMIAPINKQGHLSEVRTCARADGSTIQHVCGSTVNTFVQAICTPTRGCVVARSDLALSRPRAWSRPRLDAGRSRSCW